MAHATDYTPTEQRDLTFNEIADRARDARGRSHTAPAWNGSLDQLDASQLSNRIDALGAHIGRTTTKFHATAHPGHEYEVDVNVDEIRRWATIRATCLNELERRATAAGSRAIDLIFASPSWKVRL